MTTTRSVYATVIALVILGSACSSSNTSAPGTGGTHDSGGAPSQGGTTASGGQSGTGGITGSGGAASQGGTTASGGAVQTGTGGRMGPGSGGAGAGGRPGSGGAGLGGASTGTGGSTRSATGGSAALGGATGPGTGGTRSSGAGGATGSGGATSPGTGGTGAGVVQSEGCGKTRTLQNGTINITFSGASRKYILRVPSDYDNTHPYRLLFAFAESGASAQSVVDRNYFTMATQDSKNTIFAAPDAANGAGSWSKTDVQLTDAILAQLEGDLCIDKTRIFATGFSFGGAMSIALACTRADVFRAVAFFSGADLTGSCPTTLTKPIAYWASQASQDSSGTPSPTSGRTIQAVVAAVNGCTADPNAINFPAAGQPHTCTNYKNCSAGHPTIYCVFDGAHGWEPRDPGQTTSWAAKEAWTFITQF